MAATAEGKPFICRLQHATKERPRASIALLPFSPTPEQRARSVKPIAGSDTEERSSAAELPARVSGKRVILCLHGYLQNSEVFKAKIGSVRKGLKSRAELVFVDAPHAAAGTIGDATEAGGTTERPRAWWTWQDEEPNLFAMRPSLASSYVGWETSLQALLVVMQKVRPDGILGFSQGATAAALLLAHLSREEDLRPLLPRHAVLVAGFLPRDERYASQLRDWTVRTRLLLVHGQADTLVPPERSVRFLAALQETEDAAAQPIETFGHPGAHMVPSCTGDFKRRLQAFLDDRE